MAQMAMLGDPAHDPAPFDALQSRINVPMTMYGHGPTVPELTTHMNGLFDGVIIDPSYLKPEWGEWDYENRRNAQQVLPFVFLGPTVAAKNAAFLRDAGMTMVLNLRHARPGRAALPPAGAGVARDLGLAYELVDVYNNETLGAAFPAIVAKINRHLWNVKADTGRLGRVLICDESGNERAAAAAVAYLMANTDLDLVRAIQLAQNQRFCINLDDAMKFTLRAFENTIVTRRAAGLAPRPRGPGAAAARIAALKRTRAEMAAGTDENDMDIDDNMPIVSRPRLSSASSPGG